MATTPLLSIITINYNNAEGLEKTMSSVLSQKGITPTNFEYIIIDGGSTDGSVDVIKKFYKNQKYKDLISYWVSEPDKGIYNAMNKGITKASGTIIGLLNSADEFIPDTLCKILPLHQKNPNAILYGVNAVYSGEIYSHCYDIPHHNLPSLMIAHESSFVPKKIYDTYGYYDESYKIAGDYDTFLRFYKNNVTFMFINMIICKFDNTGISSTNTEESIKEAEIAQKKYGYYQKKKDDTLLRIIGRYLKNKIKNR